MSKDIVIYGSPKNNSFTKKLLEYHCEKPLDSLDFFDCYKMSPTPCTDCGFCKENDGCIFKDLDGFFDSFLKAENIIIAFPIYNGSFPAPLKALLDRFQRFYSARFFRNKKLFNSHKRNVTLVITAGSDFDPLPLILPQIKPIFTICGCELKKAVLLTNTDRLKINDKINPKIINY